MNIEREREAIEMGISWIGREWDESKCRCDPSVGAAPCDYCAVHAALLAGERLLTQLAEAQQQNKTGAKRYYWEQCYELGNNVHWALCDTESAKQGRVADFRLVLEHHHARCMDGRPLSEQEMPRIIATLLNGDAEQVVTEQFERIKELQAKVEEVQQQNAELRAGANYVADREQRPTTVWFKNGRKVWIVNDADGAYLDVDWQSPCVVEDAGEDEVPHA